jgi:hypothetical protein
MSVLSDVSDQQLKSRVPAGLRHIDFPPGECLKSTLTVLREGAPSLLLVRDPEPKFDARFFVLIRDLGVAVNSYILQESLEDHFPFSFPGVPRPARNRRQAIGAFHIQFPLGT